MTVPSQYIWSLIKFFVHNITWNIYHFITQYTLSLQETVCKNVEKKFFVVGEFTSAQHPYLKTVYEKT